MDILSAKQMGLLRSRILKASSKELVVFLNRLEQIRGLALEQLYVINRDVDPTTDRWGRDVELEVPK